MIIKKGDIFFANLNPILGSEQGGIRPVLIIQNDISNKYSPVVIIAAITSKVFEKEFPTNVFLSKKDTKLNKDSTVLLNQIRTIDKSRLTKKVCSIDNELLYKVDSALKISLGLTN
ncbi:MAG TPA: type II toxin-antitoxin system PemK/MazF family toxin [Candidatus Nanoarchaeia archaeon]|nr:type II toxin-antitoxin system PemK/MazF family toxin [Candidatus Nanoarchaeia archaeon]